MKALSIKSGHMLQGLRYICNDAGPLPQCKAGLGRPKKKKHNHTRCSMDILCGSRNKDILPYLQVFSLCVWKTGSPIPACGGLRKSSEAGRSTADHVEYKSLAWTAGGNTEARERERGRGEEWKRVRYSTSESAAAWRTFRHGNKHPSLPPPPFLCPSLPPPSLLQNPLELLWATSVMSAADAHTPVSHSQNSEGRWHTSQSRSA